MPGLRTIEQRITAGSDFDGTVPSGSLARADGIESYPAGSSGGLFDFSLTEPHIVLCVELHMGGQSAFTVHKRDVTGTELLCCAGTTETDYLTIAEEAFPITDGQLLVVRTTGATVDLLCRITIQTIG